MKIPGLPDTPDIPDFDLPDFDPALLFNALQTHVPLLLLPVRLETRFYHNPERLRIRIYPDQIHVNSHQTALSEVEARLGQQFWESTWQSGWDKAARVFNRMAEMFGAWRAAWVTEATAPTNLDVVGKGKGQPIFPKFETGRNPGDPAQLALLPNRWFAVGILHGETVFVEYGELIPDDLRFAPFQMQGDDDLDRWMISFDTALQKGMALEIRLNGSKQAVAAEGLDELIVLGARLGDPAEIAGMLEDTLRSHYYTRGFDFVPQGTPTNNTESVRSPWQWNGADPNDVFQRTWQLTPAAADSFRQRFAQALGLDVNGVVARAAHGDLADIPMMESMNRVLWYTTWGEYLRFVLHDGEKAPLSDADIDWVRDWFSKHVRGGAVYPAFQIGSMPYGVLPIQLQPVPQSLSSREDYLQTVLWTLRAGWERSLSDIPHLDPAATASATDAATTTDLEAANDNLISLLSSHPHPVRFFTRNLLNLREAGLLDILILFGIILDPVDWLEASLENLYGQMAQVDSLWAFATRAERVNPFDSLADQLAYYKNLVNGLDTRVEDLQNQIDDLTPDSGPIPLADRDAINALIDKRNLVDIDIRSSLEQIVAQLEKHAERVYPINNLGLPSLMDVISEDRPNPEHFYFAYLQEMTEWGDLPLVQSAAATGSATAAVYLNWLSDYARGTVSGTGPDGLPDPAPLLFQLIKRAIDRANAWENAPLFDFDDFLDGVQKASKLATPAARVNANRRLAADSQRLTNTASLLNQALKKSAKDPMYTAIASVPRSVFKTASAQLSEYQRITQTTSPALTQTINALNKWAKVPVGTPQTSGIGGTKWVKITAGSRSGQIASSISTLDILTPDELELRLTETLGLAMHRLDAWITAYAEQRIEVLRVKTPAGLQLGGYGWVENLRPDKAGSAPSQGYIHAPSMTHAAAAAVLRSGYSAYSDGTGTSPLAVDLRSDRVRIANWMMDGVRQGQRINDLLGYRFERFLHDHHPHGAALDVWISPVRDVVARAGTTELSGSSSLVTVDGLALLELWDEGSGPLENLIVPPVDADGKVHKFNEIKPALEHLVWISDAMADLALAESVHALVQGDYERASAVQSAAALGDVPPPEVRSILTPNSGMTITHRIMLLPQGTDSTWKSGDRSIRSAFEPELEAWAAAIIGVPGRVLFEVRGGVDDPVESLSLADLPLSALDAVYLAPAGDKLTGSGLAALIALAYRQRYPELECLNVTIDADIVVSDDEITLAEFILLANSVRRILGGTRAAKSSDFALDASADAEGANVSEFVQRASRMFRSFEQAIQDLADDAGRLDWELLELSHFNLPQAIPVSEQPDALAAQAESVLVAARDRLQAALKIIKPALEDSAGLSDGQLLRLAQDAVAAILGRDFPAMPRFDLPLQPEVLRAGTDVASADPCGVMGWLLKMARVRPDLSNLRDMITAAEAYQDRALFPFWVAQVPHVAGEPWAGLARPNAEGSDRLSLVLTTNGDTMNNTSSICGLVLDEWIERIPSDYEMTGLTFHYDAPTSRPPQVLLLAVPPAGSDWNFDLVLATVREAFALARLRAVAPETLGEYGHHLPAVYLSSDLDMTGVPNVE